MRARDQLLVPSDDRLGSRLGLMQRQAAAGPTEVVDPHHQNDRVGLGLTEDVGVEARQRIGSHPVGQNLRARYALVQDCDGRTADLREPFGQAVGPSIVAIDCGPIAVGDGIAKRHDSARASRRVDQDLAQENALRHFQSALKSTLAT